MKHTTYLQSISFAYTPEALTNFVLNHELLHNTDEVYTEIEMVVIFQSWERKQVLKTFNSLWRKMERCGTYFREAVVIPKNPGEQALYWKLVLFQFTKEENKREFEERQKAYSAEELAATAEALESAVRVLIKAR